MLFLSGREGTQWVSTWQSGSRGSHVVERETRGVNMAETGNNGDLMAGL